MLEELKKEVCEANLKLVKAGLVILTWGNASAITSDRKYVVIKPSGVSYDTMSPDDMVVTDLDGNIVEGDLRPSSDLPTHLELYKGFPGIGGVVHTHSRFATSFAQAEREMPCLGTTHADTFYGTVPLTRHLTDEEIREAYEKNTGTVIISTFREEGIDPEAVPAVFVRKHGPFTWGKDVAHAVESAIILEETAHMATITSILHEGVPAAPQYLLDKHYYRKHGKDAYYGQK